MKIREAQKFSDSVVDVLVNKRKQSKTSCYKIAKDCGLTEAALSYIEKHKSKPTLYSLKMIASSLNIKLSDIIKEVEDLEEQQD